ncbi:DUF4240 domain-containing protein [Streptomyces sp. NPDC050738]|uniref:DUF4240 domain-containing protein n=1 Tax=Streptomyces sp. NPDC050738 TaxID=3154744 RepID=UPI00343082A6
MDTEAFWGLIHTARSTNQPFHEALVDLLVARSKTEILSYQEHFDQARGALYRWDIWAAAYLIGGGCSDDSFMDFRAGLIAQGRTWYDQAAGDPDSLAAHPAALASLGTIDRSEELFYEEVNYAASEAFERITGNRDAFYEAWDARTADSDTGADEHNMGEDFDFDDPAEMHQRLPRLATLFLSPAGGQA